MGQKEDSNGFILIASKWPGSYLDGGRGFFRIQEGASLVPRPFFSASRLLLVHIARSRGIEWFRTWNLHVRGVNARVIIDEDAPLKTAHRCGREDKYPTSPRFESANLLKSFEEKRIEALIGNQGRFEVNLLLAIEKAA